MSNKNGDGQLRELHRALITISHSVRRLHAMLDLESELDLDAFQQVLDSKLLIQLNPDYPLMVAITGGGSTGKSSLFNALMGKEISAVKARAGHSRRVLAGMHPSVRAEEDFFQSLFSAFGALPEPLESIEELLTPGTPRFVACDEVPTNMVLLDTPDFDTGDRENYANRDFAKPVLEACDVLVYIFTNATYNNRENTGFMRQVLTGIGSRKVALVYRCSRTYSEDDVVQHAETVAHNLYGDEFKKNLVGIYRVNEDDVVADGKGLMKVEPVAGFLPFAEMLTSLDRLQTRADFVRSALLDIRRDAQLTVDSAALTRMQLEVYGDAVRVATSWAATEALKAFPAAAVSKRMLEIWEESAPRSKKILRAIGKVTAWPGRKLWSAGSRLWGGRYKSPLPSEESLDPNKVFRENLQLSANTLRNKLMNRDIAVEAALRNQECRHMIELVEKMRSCSQAKKDLPVAEEVSDSSVNIRISRPTVLKAEKLMNASMLWKQVLQNLCEEAEGLGEVSPQINQQLNDLINKFRAEMGPLSKTGELAASSLPTLATLGALTYVVCSGDLAGAATIQAKVVAMFGLNDLLALAAIPASTGLDFGHRTLLAILFKPIYESWLNEKIIKIRDLQKKYVSGPMLTATEEILKESQKPFDELIAAILQLPEGEPNE